MYSFNYHTPTDLDEALKIYENSDDPKYLAGGMTLIASMKQRLASPSDLIDLTKIDSLKSISNEEGQIKIGALATHNTISKNIEINEHIKGLKRLSTGIGDQAIRNFGTIGGSIANGDPAADWPAAILSIKTTIITNKRQIAGEDFFTGMFETALEENEILTHIIFEIPTYFTYIKFPNPASRYAIAGIALSTYDKDVRIAITGASHTPFRASEIESALTENFDLNNVPLNTIALEDMNNDIHASAEYRSHLVDVLVKKAVKDFLK